MHRSTISIFVSALVLALSPCSTQAYAQRQTAADVLLAKRVFQARPMADWHLEPQPNDSANPSSSSFSRRTGKRSLTSHHKRACKPKVQAALVAPTSSTSNINNNKSSKTTSTLPASSSSLSSAANTPPSKNVTAGFGSGNSANSTASIAGKSKDNNSNIVGNVLGVAWDSLNGFLSTGNLVFGFLPDDGSGGGKSETLSAINAIMPAKSVFYGRYAQVTNGKTFDGSQLYQVLDDVKKTGSILAASVMPYGTWDGLTYKDNRNAIAIAKVCKDIQDKHGIEVWLRFAHEMNWYQTDGTYAGGVSNFQEGWDVVASAIDQISPNTKLWWSPNVGSDADYAKYYPKKGRVDVVGFDYYANSGSESFVNRAQKFHDTYAVNGRIMVQGETGLHYSGSIDDRIAWLKQLVSPETQKAMPNYLGAMWFNYNKFENGKQIEFRIVDTDNKGSNINSASHNLFSSMMK